MGCRVKRESDRVTVSGGDPQGGGRGHGGHARHGAHPCGSGPFRQGKNHHFKCCPSQIQGKRPAERRGPGMGKLGGRVEEFEDSLVIHGNEPLHEAQVDPHDDHRLAMSLAVIGLKVPGISFRIPPASINLFRSFGIYGKICSGDSHLKRKCQ
jgi:3-phosphoshikimate 1-carboxyvinyltransferase